MQCTDELLNHYSLEHYTYINQIFGDETVRSIITEIFKSKKYAFFIEAIPQSELFDEGFHHILVNKRKPDETLYCSVAAKHQKPLKNVNDTLCQTYSLLAYMGRDIDPIMKSKTYTAHQKIMLVHKEMIAMYRDIIANKKFVREFNTIDFKNTKDASGRKMFRDYTNSKNPPLNLDSEDILKNISALLDKWESYGYRIFIGSGKCARSRTPSKYRVIPDLNTKLEEYENRKKT